MNKNNNNTPKKQKNKINTKIYTYYTAKEKLQISIEDSGITEELIAILRELDNEECKDNRNHDLHKQFENDLFENLELIDTTQLKALTTNSKFSTIEIEILKKEQIEKLYYSINTLNNKEVYLIKKLFFEEKSERELANEFNISQKNINKFKQKILKKLRLEITKC